MRRLGGIHDATGLLGMVQRPAGSVSQLLTGLTSYWKLDESSGSRLDSHGSNDLTDNNTVTSGTGMQGQAASFVRASSQYLSRADNAQLSLTNTACTFAGWAKPASLPGADMGVVSKFDASDEYNLIVSSVNRFRWQFRVTQVASTVAVVAGTWYFWACGYDDVADLVWVRVNGETRVTASQAIGTTDGTNPFLIGASRSTQQFFDGLVDEVGFWRGRSLSDADLDYLYNAGSGRTYPL